MAVGVNGSTGWSEVVFFRSEDGGFRWTSSPSQRRTYSTIGSISFSSSGDFGLCGVFPPPPPLFFCVALTHSLATNTVQRWATTFLGPLMVGARG